MIKLKIRPTSEIVKENLEKLMKKSGMTKAKVIHDIGRIKIIDSSKANIAVNNLDRLAKYFNTNVPDLVTDWENGSYPDTFDEYKRGFEDGRKSIEKEMESTSHEKTISSRMRY